MLQKNKNKSAHLLPNIIKKNFGPIYLKRPIIINGRKWCIELKTKEDMQSANTQLHQNTQTHKFLQFLNAFIYIRITYKFSGKISGIVRISNLSGWESD